MAYRIPRAVFTRHNSYSHGNVFEKSRGEYLEYLLKVRITAMENKEVVAARSIRIQAKDHVLRIWVQFLNFSICPGFSRHAQGTQQKS